MRRLAFMMAAVLAAGAASAQEAVIRIDDNPVRETRMVLADGRTERRFNTTSDLIISVSNPLVSHVADEAWGRIKQVSTGAVRGELY